MLTETETEIGPTDNTTLYRKMVKESQPIVNHKHLQFIHTYNDETILLGSGDLSGRFWNGSAWLFDGCSTFDKSKAFVTTTIESSPCDGAFIDYDKFAIVENNGALQIFQIVENPNTQSNEVLSLGYECQHDDSILSASLFDSKTRLITGGMDRCIKIWNVADLIAEHSYDGAHRKIISCVNAKPKSDDIFASSSLDSEAVVWDSRQENPAKVVYSKTGRQLLTIAWHPSSENILAFGGVDGAVSFVDIRQPQETLNNFSIFQRPIHKIKFDPKRPHLLAICGDSNELKVLDTKINDENGTIYNDKRHSDFIRGIAWYNDSLLTCSWDNTVLKHEIMQPPVEGDSSTQ